MNFNDVIHNIYISQKAAMGVFLAITGLMLITFIYSVWQWHHDWVLAHQASDSLPTINLSPASNPATAAIPGAALFGKNAAKLGDVPISDLQLQVTGISKVDGEHANTASKAYISIAGQPAKIFKIGDSLPYGVKVYEITSDAVVLENNGRLEKLPLPRERLQFKSRPAATLQPPLPEEREQDE